MKRFLSQSSDLPQSSKQKTNLIWNYNGSILNTTHLNPQIGPKIAAFDFDGCLVKTKSGKVHAKDSSDWMFLNSSIKPNLETILNEGFLIVIFTNQKGLFDNKRSEIFKDKISKFSSALGLPFLLFASTCQDFNRKPGIGMWHFLLKTYSIEPDIESSFFVGDAAGRPHNWSQNRTKDHSDSDRKFALNLSLKFHTPESFFLKREKYVLPDLEFDPLIHLNKTTSNSTLDISHLSTPHVILLVGPPASGKSSLVKQHFSNHTHISLDIHKTKEKCSKLMIESLEKSLNCVIDNTNPDQTSRNYYINLAKQFNVSVICIIMKTDKNLCLHNNSFRALFKGGNHVPKIVFNMFYSKFKEPDNEEGFNEIINVQFVPLFESKEDEMNWKLHLP